VAGARTAAWRSHTSSTAWLGQCSPGNLCPCAPTPLAQQSRAFPGRTAVGTHLGRHDCVTYSTEKPVL
jgi:hypothetical protein